MDPPGHPCLVHWDDVEPELHDVGELRSRQWELGAAAGAFRAGVNRVRVEPGGRSSPVHCHADEEELFFVLGGSCVLLLDDAEHPVRRGSVVARPPQAREAHAFRAGPDGLTYLAWGTREPADLAPYTTSQTLGVRGLKFRVEPLDPWDGE